MLTRLPIDLPTAEFGAGTVEERLARLEQEHRRTLESLLAIFEGLNKEGVLDIADAVINGTPIGATSADTGEFTTLEVVTSSIFPVASFTPALTFDTAGNLSVTYSEQHGRVIKLGEYRLAFFGITTSAFTHTTASGAARITGLTDSSANVTNNTATGSLVWQGITKAGYTSVSVTMNPNLNYMSLVASGSGVGVSAVSTSDMPTGGTVVLRGALFYRAA
jgi:hypothetical protein